MEIGIVGLGLMGGSIALSLKKLPFVTSVVGSDHNLDHQKTALELGLVDDILLFEDLKKRCDVIFFAVPVDGVVGLLNQSIDLAGTDKTLIDLDRKSVV
jgi:prephenate dehydrogenase